MLQCLTSNKNVQFAGQNVQLVLKKLCVRSLDVVTFQFSQDFFFWIIKFLFLQNHTQPSQFLLDCIFGK